MSEFGVPPSDGNVVSHSRTSLVSGRVRDFRERTRFCLVVADFSSLAAAPAGAFALSSECSSSTVAPAVVGGGVGVVGRSLTGFVALALRTAMGAEPFGPQDGLVALGGAFFGGEASEFNFSSTSLRTLAIVTGSLA